ncbi:hypothetical protein LJC33_02615 [Eubacteriales bacterium OttesenSCG-928-N13]|nr:hypothetical protein [Eubacteriales bacterium OttesenSCG-928-N13]
MKTTIHNWANAYPNQATILGVVGLISITAIICATMNNHYKLSIGRDGLQLTPQ